MAWRSAIVVFVLTLSVAVPHSGDEPDANKFAVQQPGKVKDLMRAKLAHSQKVLEGIATGNFEQIARHADDLLQVSKSLEWQVLKTPRYELHSSEFRRSAETLVEQAREKNLDGAALAYVDLTLNCVKCHKYVRAAHSADK